MVSKHVQSCYFIQHECHLYLIDEKKKVFHLKRHENTTWVNTMTSFESFKASEKKGTI